MKNLLSFLIIAVLISSCGTSTSFSKRKHLKGHFWNKSGGIFGVEDKSQEEDPFRQKECSQYYKSKEASDNEEAQVPLQNHVEEEGELNVVEELEIEPFPNTEDQSTSFKKNQLDDQKLIELRDIEQDSEGQTSSSKQGKYKNPRELNIIVGLFVAWCLLGILGLFFLVLWFILAALEAVGIWMLITGLSIIGFCILAFIVFIFCMIFII